MENFNDSNISWQILMAFGGVVFGFFLNEFKSQMGNIKIYCSSFSKQIIEKSNNGKILETEDIEKAISGSFKIKLDIVNNYRYRKNMREIRIIFKNNKCIVKKLLKSSDHHLVHDRELEIITIEAQKIERIDTYLIMERKELLELTNIFDVYFEYKNERNKVKHVKILNSVIIKNI